MGRIIVVGDRNQCQPAGTLVDVVSRRQERWNDGIIEKRPIESLQVGDIVVSYSFGDRQWRRSREITGTSQRYYSGELISVRGDGFYSRYTPNHRCLVSFANLRNKWCVYLMQRNCQYRVGKARMDYGNNIGGGLSSRMRAEGADAAWILCICDNDHEARLQEATIAVKFGIPQYIFKTTNVSKYTQNELDKIWDAAGGNAENASRCLLFHKRDILFPLISTKQTNWTKSLKRPMFTQACNLIDGCMVLPYKLGSTYITDYENRSHVRIRKDNWISVNVGYESYEGFVHSLAVDKDETYVADGIVTHNSIYGFRGASVEAIPDLLEMMESRKNGCREFPLSVCRRSPISHIRLAQAIVPEIQWMTKENSGVDAPEGEIYQVSENVALDRMIEGDMGIGRVNKVLIPAAYTLIRMRKKVIIRGRDIGTGLIALIKKMRAKSIEELLRKLHEWFEKEVAKLCAKEKVDKPALLVTGATKYQSLEDRVGCIEALCDGIETLDELISTIEKLFGDFDDDGQPKQAVVLGTVHRTKGLEAHNITILDPENFPHPLGRKSWERVQERNLAYVSVTRSKFVLNKDGSVKEPGRLTFIGQCPSIFKASWLAGRVQYPEFVTKPIQSPKDISVLQRSVSQANKERDELEKQAVEIFQKQFQTTRDAALKSVKGMTVTDLQQVVNARKNSDGSNKRMSSEEKKLLDEKWRAEAEIRAIEEAMF